MIGLWSELAATYLLIVTAITFLFFTIPLIVSPLAWARVLGWRIPEPTHLALYLGRSLGVLSLSINVISVRAALSGEGAETVFGLMLLVSALMVPLHLWGWIRKLQPLSESLETFFWAALAFLTLAFWPSS
jgi:hypothetical protein